MSDTYVQIIRDEAAVVQVVTAGPQGPSGSGSGGAVSSVFGRIGAVAATTGDYTASQIYGLGTAAVATIGTGAANVIIGNDARLTDARTPTNHDHASNKLAQANTHESADTDSATTSLHHTLGTGANQAAAGDHSHSNATTGAAGFMSSTDKTKLDGIAAGAGVNVNADWSASSGDAQILNKPTLGDAAAKNVGTGANDVAAGNHTHTSTYEPAQTAASQAEMEAGTETALRSMTPQRVKQAILYNDLRIITLVIDGGGAAITAGVKGYIQLPFACTITAWRMFADQSGSITIDVWKDTYANFPPTNDDAMPGSGKEPALSSVQKAEDTDVTDWTTDDIAAGDILAFNVDTLATSITRVTLQLFVRRAS